MIYRSISKAYPKKIKKGFVDNIKYLDYKTDPEVLLGAATLLTFLFSVSAAFLLGIQFKTIPPYVTWIGFFLLIHVVMHLRISIKVDAIAKKIEVVLPDALQVMASNLKAGLTMDQALLASAKPEFGLFEKEMNRIGKEITLGKEIEVALLASAKRIKSEKYNKTMNLIVSGMRSGGKLAELLSQSSENLRQQNLVDEKIRSNVMMYVIFIFAAIAFGAPILFGLSSFLVKVLSSVFSQIDVPASATLSTPLPIASFSQISIGEGFIINYSIISLAVSGVMGGLIIGLIAKGKGKAGVKYIPLLIGSALLIFLLTRVIVASLLGGLLTI